MDVILSRTFFAPNHNRYKKGRHVLPEAWRDRLPSDAEIVDEPVEEAPVEPVDETVTKPAAKAKVKL